eukprot:7270605-Prymnesium_polylepis.1
MPSHNVVERIQESLKSVVSTIRYEVEEFGSALLGDCPLVEIKFWQDGTLSDAGMRPIGEHRDQWLPIQLKSTMSTSPPYVFNNCNKYSSMCMIGTTGERKAFVLYDSECFVNGQIKKGKKCDPLTLDELSTMLLLMWSDAFYANELHEELVLRNQCSRSSQLELAVMSVSSFVVDGTPINWPNMRNSVVDRILTDGTRVQDKVAYRRSRNFTGSLMRKFRGAKVPYVDGDVDTFVFSYIMPENARVETASR